jgi:hypothetical protein
MYSTLRDKIQVHKAHSAVGKLLVVNRQITPDPIKVIIVKEKMGY